MSGVDAYQSGRLAEAIRDLQQARDRLQPLLRANPGDRDLASRLGICLMSLGAARRDSDRPALALASIQESQRLLEALIDPGPVDLYNLACCYSQISLLSQHAASPATLSERAALLDRAMEALRRPGGGLQRVRFGGSRQRSRPAPPPRRLQALTLDRGFPKNPFAR